MATRSLLKHRVFTAINLIGLSSGVAVALLMALYIDYEMSFDDHFEHSERIFRVHQRHLQDESRSTAGLHFPAAGLMAQDYPEIESITRIHPLLPRLGTYNEQSFMEDGYVLADPEVFTVFGLKALAGSLETALRQPTDMVITERIAKKYFGYWQNQEVIGATFKVKNTTEYQIVAVIPDLPDNTHFNSDIFLPFGKVYGNFITNNWNFSSFYTYALVDPNTTAASLEISLEGFTSKYYPEQRSDDFGLGVQPVSAIHLKSDLQGELAANGSMSQIHLFALIALLIVAIAAMNFINLLTAMASSRHKEVGIKKVLGAAKKSLIGQFLAEALVLSALAHLAAIGLADLVLGFFSRLVEVNLSLSTLWQPGWISGFVILLLLIGLVSGMYPAFYLSRLGTVRALKNNEAGKSKGLLRKVLVTTQFVITTILIIGVITVFQQLNFMRDKDLGFDKEAVVMLKSHPNLNKQYHVFRNELMSHPSIDNVSFGYGNLLGGGSFAVRAQLDQDGGTETTAVPLLYTDYALEETLGLNLVSGRWFSKDFATDTTRAFVINQAAAKAFGWEGEALGKRIKYFGGGTTSIEKDGQVVGVVSDFFHESLYEELQPLIITLSHTYVPTFPNAYIPVKVQGKGVKQAMETIEATWDAKMPGIPVEMSFLDNKLQRLYARDQRFGQVINAATLLALLIAAIGVFGLASFIARSRTKELGIRKVLGASVKELLSMMVTGFLKPVLLALVIAVPLAVYLLNGWLDGFAYKIEMTAEIFLFTALISFFVAIAAVSGQSLKAAKTNPVNTLRND